MNRTSNRVLLAAAISAIAGTAAAQAIHVPRHPDARAAIGAPDDVEARPVIQLALLLDTSNSMDGLINQARARLWNIVNEFNACNHDGVRPNLQVALYQYGNNTLPAEEGYVQQVTPFTSDLDLLSEKLFALTTNGGSEFCAWTIRDAASHLDWVKPTEMTPVVRVMVIAGNEPFTQGPVDFRDAVPGAFARGITVNTIHCGDYATGSQTGWQEGAQLGGGSYHVIDADKAIRHIPSPHDDAIFRLEQSLNKTYIYYGTDGSAMAARQESADQMNMRLSPAAALDRAAAKSGGSYKNAGWDLIDAAVEPGFDWDGLDTDQLPEDLQKKSIQEIQEAVKIAAEKREELQQQIQSLSDKRDAYIAAERTRIAAEENSQDLGDALLEALREQAEQAGFEFE